MDCAPASGEPMNIGVTVRDGAYFTYYDEDAVTWTDDDDVVHFMVEMYAARCMQQLTHSLHAAAWFQSVSILVEPVKCLISWFSNSTCKPLQHGEQDVPSLALDPQDRH